jgi:hypothetical protein
MFVETFEDNSETYERFEQDDWQKLKGKRTNHGQIVGWTNAEGELHPAYLETDEGRYLTPGDLRHNVDFDGRHNVIELDSVDDTEDTDDSEDHDSEEVQLVTDGGQSQTDGGRPSSDEIENTLVFDTETRFKGHDPRTLVAEGVHEHGKRSVRTAYILEESSLYVRRYYRYEGERLNQYSGTPWSVTNGTVDYNGQELRQFIKANFHADPEALMTEDYESHVSDPIHDDIDEDDVDERLMADGGRPTINEIEQAIPDERKSMSFGDSDELLGDVLDQADRDAHERGQHDGENHADCPLCEPEAGQ